MLAPTCVSGRRDHLSIFRVVVTEYRNSRNVWHATYIRLHTARNHFLRKAGAGYLSIASYPAVASPEYFPMPSIHPSIPTTRVAAPP